MRRNHPLSPTKERRRPKKHGKALRRRQKVHCERLVRLGLSEAIVMKLNTSEVRELLKNPAKAQALAASSAAAA